MNPLPNLIARPKAAKLLDVHPVTLKRYEKRGLLVPIRLSLNRVAYDIAEVEKLVSNAAVKVAPIK